LLKIFFTFFSKLTPMLLFFVDNNSCPPYHCNWSCETAAQLLRLASRRVGPFAGAQVNS